MREEGSQSFMLSLEIANNYCELSSYESETVSQIIILKPTKNSTPAHCTEWHICPYYLHNNTRSRRTTTDDRA